MVVHESRMIQNTRQSNLVYSLHFETLINKSDEINALKLFKLLDLLGSMVEYLQYFMECHQRPSPGGRSVGY